MQERTFNIFSLAKKQLRKNSANLLQPKPPKNILKNISLRKNFYV